MASNAADATMGQKKRKARRSKRSREKTNSRTVSGGSELDNANDGGDGGEVDVESVALLPPHDFVVAAEFFREESDDRVRFRRAGGLGGGVGMGTDNGMGMGSVRGDRLILVENLP